MARPYLADDLLQEAGDSLVMKLGEAAIRLSRLGVLAPDGVERALAVANRNFIIHQYDAINRELAWLTISRDLPSWKTPCNPCSGPPTRPLSSVAFSSRPLPHAARVSGAITGASARWGYQSGPDARRPLPVGSHRLLRMST